MPTSAAKTAPMPENVRQQCAKSGVKLDISAGMCYNAEEHWPI